MNLRNGRAEYPPGQMPMSKDQDQNPPPPQSETRAAKAVVTSLTAAFKASSFYPQEHAFTRKHFSRLAGDLNAFLEEYSELRLKIAKNSFYYDDELLQDGSAEENNPAYLLTRDGLVYLHFFQGIEPREISALLGILVRYRNPGEHEDGDIVTALWREELPHIGYEEVDIFALEGFEFDLTGFHVAPAAPPVAADEPDTAPDLPPGGTPPAEGSESFAAAADPLPSSLSELLQREQGSGLFDISSEEKKALAALIAEQEEKDYTSDVIDVLLIILASQKKRSNFAGVLEFIRHQFFDTMNRGAFHLSYKLLNNLAIIRDQLQGVRPWVKTTLDEYFSILASRENLSALDWISGSDSLAGHSRHLAFLWKTLRRLPPESLFTLGPLAGRLPMEMINIRNELLAIVESKAAAAPDSFQAMLQEADDDTALLLSPLVESLPVETRADVYLQMTGHSCVEVRKMGLDGYMMLAADPDYARILPLLGDETPLIRERMISYLSDAGPETTESVLIRFLEQAVKTADLEHRYIFEYYKILGRCGSSRCVPFLERVLLKGSLGSMFSNINAMHKRGAAMALRMLGDPECLAILEKGRQSLRPDLRLACQHALRK